MIICGTKLESLKDNGLNNLTVSFLLSFIKKSADRCGILIVLITKSEVCKLFGSQGIARNEFPHLKHENR